MVWELYALDHWCFGAFCMTRSRLALEQTIVAHCHVVCFTLSVMYMCMIPSRQESRRSLCLCAVCPWARQQSMSWAGSWPFAVLGRATGTFRYGASVPDVAAFALALMGRVAISHRRDLRHWSADLSVVLVVCVLCVIATAEKRLTLGLKLRLLPPPRVFVLVPDLLNA